MRRLARRLFTLTSVLSLLVCVTVCVLWVRSYWYFDDVWYTAGVAEGKGKRWKLGFATDRGTLYPHCGYDWKGDTPREPAELLLSGQPQPATPRSRLRGNWDKRVFGFGHFVTGTGGTTGFRMHYFAAPFWFPAAATGVLPLAVFTYRKVRSRSRDGRPGLCP